ncbi:DUF4157 domain-containing protein [Mucilaginibacter sp. X5P1]|uniref:eCIS core domain-containing protein n=1 Tax=Mucilaginibacter sp. X5P1 TaxID=2723088 RepID=UPI001621A60B|nr:DUF4157 domain-containing protein [Mucilaginibacter sp. X5P1]MBB6139843.1 hypothetical protein [Mucilaginibacter sp. X5P1]
MSIHGDKAQQNKSHAFANAPVQKQNSNSSTPKFIDNRPETIVQRKLQEAINNSPRVQQLKDYQASADNYIANKTAQRKENTEGEPIQGKFEPVQKKANYTGLPDNLKSGVEQLSGYAMDDVKVHYNSSQPARLNSLAYAQGADIHIAPGQEKHLPHEAWHVVQQMQGRVRPTLQMKSGVAVNDDKELENEADVMGNKLSSFNEKNTKLPVSTGFMLPGVGRDDTKTGYTGSQKQIQVNNVHQAHLSGATIQLRKLTIGEMMGYKDYAGKKKSNIEAALEKDGKGYDKDDLKNIQGFEIFLECRENYIKYKGRIQRIIENALTSTDTITKNTARFIDGLLTRVYPLAEYNDGKYFPKTDGAYHYKTTKTPDEILDELFNNMWEEEIPDGAHGYTNPDNKNIGIIMADDTRDEGVLITLIHEVQHLVDGSLYKTEKIDAEFKDDEDKLYYLKSLEIFKSEIRAHILSAEYTLKGGKYVNAAGKELLDELKRNYVLVRNGIAEDRKRRRIYDKLPTPFLDIIEKPGVLIPQILAGSHNIDNDPDLYISQNPALAIRRNLEKRKEEEERKGIEEKKEEKPLDKGKTPPTPDGPPA